ncbi:MAG: signal peptide peptidase SppA [Bryobacterales bacterium]|nr:signal peptide peptidase SppA [Bryobacterales bacterium]MBV9401660.1 signal peptide peptidase SppA [Bryobacterales bacterium]
MGKFFLGFFIGLVFAVLFGVILAFAAIRVGQSRPSVASNSVLVLHLEGDVPEQNPVELPLPFLQQQQPVTIVEAWQVLRDAASDNRVKAVVLEPRNLTAGWGKLQQLRSDIAAFRKSGKPVYAFLKGAGMHEYYVATAADKIYMSPEDELDVKGLRAELIYVKGTLDKLGVSMEFEHVGRYKDAPDTFTRTSPSPETLEVNNEILDQYFGDIISVISEGRKKKPEDVRAAIDQGPFVGKGALDAGLVDDLIYEDQVYGKLDSSLGKLTRVGERNYSRAQTPASGAKRIAFLVGDGDITRGSTNEDELSATGITETSMIKRMREVENDSSIQGVIFRIDSPGGDGIASDDILHEAKIMSQKKPTVISMSDLAASGGYFIAMTGDPVIAEPNTLTGSIGVFFGRVNLKGLYDKIGIKKDALTRGRYANIDSENGPLTDDERAKLKKEIEVFYRGFVQRVSTARKRDYDQVEPLAQGRVWTGEQAHKNGLVDQLGGLDEAVQLIRQRAKIGASEKITLVAYPPKRSLFEMLFSRSNESEVETRIRSMVGRLPIRSLAHGGILRLMPFAIEVK